MTQADICTSHWPPFLDRRRAGIILHPTSLPGGCGNGDIGSDAYRFVEFLVASGFSVWQILPLGPTHTSGSPYQTVSVHAGNPLLVSLQKLVERGWLEPDAIPQPAVEGRDPQAQAQACAVLRKRALGLARTGFQRSDDKNAKRDFVRFREEQQHWLDEFALYMGLKLKTDQAPWWDWPEPLRDRRPSALAAARKELADPIQQYCFEQFVFYQQWIELKQFANDRGVLLYGDMPIFVAEDSADTWAQRHYFELDERGRPKEVAGVPPDYFSETGQRWGNPHYRWDVMEADGFAWWMQRMHSQLTFYDLVRVDHFRGFESYWSIPGEATTAIEGKWIKAPGEALFRRLRQEFNPLPVIAEDLGIITPEVETLREEFGLPGMKVLQFAFGSGPSNPYLPHNHAADFVVYTGTHDNDTSLGWFQGLPAELQQEVQEYLGVPQEDMPWPLIRAAMSSTAALAVVPLQDVLGLDSRHRMNTPGTTEGNWCWRFSWDQVLTGLEKRLHRLTQLYGR